MAAQAGIGAGVAVVGATAIVCGIFWFRYLRKRQMILAGLHQQPAYPQPAYPPPPDATEMWKLQVPHAAGQHAYYQMDSNTRRSPAELGAY